MSSKGYRVIVQTERGEVITLCVGNQQNAVDLLNRTVYYYAHALSLTLSRQSLVPPLAPPVPTDTAGALAVFNASPYAPNTTLPTFFTSVPLMPGPARSST